MDWFITVTKVKKTVECDTAHIRPSLLPEVKWLTHRDTTEISEQFYLQHLHLTLSLFLTPPQALYSLFRMRKQWKVHSCLYLQKCRLYKIKKNHTWMHGWYTNCITHCWIIRRWLYIKWYNITQVTILLHTCMYTYTHKVIIHYIPRLYTELHCTVGEVWAP